MDLVYMSQNVIQNKIKINSGLDELIRSNLPGFNSDDFKWIDNYEEQHLQSISRFDIGFGCFERINDIKRINKSFELVNEKLELGQFFVSCLETKDTRKERIFGHIPKLIRLPYYFVDFLFTRVIPKLSLTKQFYFSVTGGKNRVVSLTESLGRLYSCGFEIIGYQRIGYLTYIISKKIDKPSYDMQPTYGALVKLKRVGKNAELFDVYKLRTMHPYSEYLQEFAYKKNSLQEGGKIRDDFRITNWGKTFRKLWIDELPMILNVLKGEMKLVGVRPLSRHYFGLYPENLQALRTESKPGLVPPFYVDLPETLDEIIESEKKYLEKYFKNPLRTDISYFFKALYNIFIKRVRST